MLNSRVRENACECRSVLYMPASNLKVVNKGPSLEADAVILDLEDSVAPNQKEQARENVINAFAKLDYGYRLRAVRVNTEDTPWYAEDIEAAVRAQADAIVLPKVESADHVQRVSDLIDKYDSNQNVRIWIMMESPMAVLNAQSIASRSIQCPRLEAMLLGNNDMARASNMQVSKDRQYLIPWIMQLVAAAHAYSLAVWDGVFNDFADIDGFKAECEEAVKMGMHGKTLIHPAQLNPCNESFFPDGQKIERATQIVAAFQLPENSNLGAIQIEGEMVERLHLDMAEQLLERVERLRSRKTTPA